VLDAPQRVLPMLGKVGAQNIRDVISLKGVARSYGEAVLKTLPLFGLKPDRAETERWYAKAKSMMAQN
jgi:hypothetical protein